MFQTEFFRSLLALAILIALAQNGVSGQCGVQEYLL
jgi:hypothetical protein